MSAKYMNNRFKLRRSCISSELPLTQYLNPMYQCELAPVIQTAYALKCNNLDIARRLQKLFIWHMLAR